MYLIYGISSSYFLYDLIYKKLKFLEEEWDMTETEEKYRPFIIRRYNQSKFSMFFCCIFLVPTRLILIIIAYLINYTIAKILLLGDKNYAIN